MAFLCFGFLTFLTAFFCSSSLARSSHLDVQQVTIYSVVDGEERVLSLSRDHLESGTSLCIMGYVSGIVVACGEGVKVSVEGQEADRIRMLPDGSLLFKYFGRIRSEALVESAIESGYCLFPRVAGDIVIPKSEFTISITDGLQTVALPVHHSTYTTICSLNAESGEKTNPVTFRYLGKSSGSGKQPGSATSDPRLSQELSTEDLVDLPADFPARSRAIAGGIALAERTFQMDLVSGVNIVDYRKTRNAVTCEDGRDIWFYGDTFLSEPLGELATIATHESLHKYVARMEFPLRSDIRDLFADLKGYDSFSTERFMLMMTGRIPTPGQGAAASEVETLFFDFIDERNFLEGMKGGHSHSGIEELCVSFLQSLLHIDRLARNLSSPIIPYGNPQVLHHLTGREKTEILALYIRTIQALKESLHWAPEDITGSTGRDPSRAFFEGCLAKAQAVQRVVSRDFQGNG